MNRTKGHVWVQRFDTSSAAAECTDCGLVFTHADFWGIELPQCPGPQFRLILAGGPETTEGRHRSDRS